LTFSTEPGNFCASPPTPGVELPRLSRLAIGVGLAPWGAAGCSTGVDGVKGAQLYPAQRTGFPFGKQIQPTEPVLRAAIHYPASPMSGG